MIKFKKALPTLVCTFLEKGGLYQIIFRFLFRFSLFLGSFWGLYSIRSVYPLFCRALLKIGAASRNLLSLDDIDDILIETDFGICLITSYQDDSILSECTGLCCLSL